MTDTNDIDPPEAPIHYNSTEASAWCSGWSAGRNAVLAQQPVEAKLDLLEIGRQVVAQRMAQPSPAQEAPTSLTDEQIDALMPEPWHEQYDHEGGEVVKCFSPHQVRSIVRAALGIPSPDTAGEKT